MPYISVPSCKYVHPESTPEMYSTVQCALVSSGNSGCTYIIYSPIEIADIHSVAKNVCCISRPLLMRFILCRAMDLVWALESARGKSYLRKCTTRNILLKMGKFEFLER